MPIYPPDPQNDARECPRIDFLDPVQVKPFTEDQAFLRSAAGRRFVQEFAYYRADAPYLSVEKCADRCRRLSQLLSAALGHNNL
jgi:hypothetical protein